MNLTISFYWLDLEHWLLSIRYPLNGDESLIPHMDWDACLLCCTVDEPLEREEENKKKKIKAFHYIDASNATKVYFVKKSDIHFDESITVDVFHFTRFVI